MTPQPLIDPAEVSADRIEDDEADWTDRKATERARRAAEARHHSGRRPLVDPATCERDYNTEEIEFMQAMQEYKKSSGRMFPTWSEVLEVLIALGYRKAEPGPVTATSSRRGEDATSK